MVSRVRFSALALFLILVAGCGSSTEITGTGATAVTPATVSDETKELSQTTQTALSSVSADGATYTFAGTNEELADLSTDDVMVFGVTDATPYGAMRKIVSITEVDGQTVVETAQATLEDIVEEGTLEVSMTLTPSNMKSATMLKGVSLIRETANQQKAREATVEVEPFVVSLGSVQIVDGITVDGTITIEPSFDFDANLSILSGISSIHFTGIIKETLTITLSASAEVTVNIKKQIASFKGTPVPIPSAPFIFVTPGLDIYVGIDGKMTAAVSTGVTQTATITGGLEWTEADGFSPVKDLTNSFTQDAPDFSATLTAKAYAGPELSLLIMGLVGPTLGVNGYLLLEADTDKTPLWQLYGGVEVIAGLSFGAIKEYVDDLEDWKETVLDTKDLLTSAPLDAVVASINGPASGYTSGEEETITFSGTGTTDSSLVWTSSRDGQIGTGESVSTSGLSAGTHTITLTATGSTGVTGTSTISVTVTAQAYTFGKITSPAKGAEVGTWDYLQFNTPVKDEDGDWLTAVGVTGVGGAAYHADHQDHSIHDVTNVLYGWNDENGWIAIFQPSSVDLNTAPRRRVGDYYSIGDHTVTLSYANAWDPISGWHDNPDGIYTDLDSVTFTVVESPPVVDITGPSLVNRRVVEGTAITFEGLGKYYEDVGVVGLLTGSKLVWTSNLDGQIGTGETFSTSTLSKGTHTITLTATGSDGKSSETSITVYVTNDPPAVTISGPADNSTYLSGATITFTGSATDPEDGALTGSSLVWTSSKDGQIGTGETFSTTTLTDGNHTITLTATDSKGAAGTDIISIVVGTEAPTAVISGPAEGTFEPGATVTFTGSGTDPEDGALTGSSLVWTSSIDGQIGTGETFSTTTLSDGTHTITLTATDSVGAFNAMSIGIIISSGAKVIAVEAGYYHTVALKSDGTVWAWGANWSGMLGDGTTTDSPTPVQVSSLTDVTAIAVGIDGNGGHTVALKNDGTVWTWGYGWSGQFGNGTSEVESSIPVQADITGVTAITAGDGYTIALKADGTVWAWGHDQVGNLLGDGTWGTDILTPTQASITDVTAIAAGDEHTVALKSDGTVWAWGQNSEGQAGYEGGVNTTQTPVQADIAGVTAIAAGLRHTVALKTDGTVWEWGETINSADARSTPVQSSITNVTAIAAGEYYTVALKSDGTVWAWGSNSDGQLGDGTWDNSNTPVQVSGLTDVTAISAGFQHAIAVKTDGAVWTWGDNDSGQLGDGTTDDAWAQVNGVWMTLHVQVSGLD